MSREDFRRSKEHWTRAFLKRHLDRRLAHRHRRRSIRRRILAVWIHHSSKED